MKEEKPKMEKKEIEVIHIKAQAVANQGAEKKATTKGTKTLNWPVAIIGALISGWTAWLWLGITGIFIGVVCGFLIGLFVKDIRKPLLILLIIILTFLAILGQGRIERQLIGDWMDAQYARTGKIPPFNESIKKLQEFEKTRLLAPSHAPEWNDILDKLEGEDYTIVKSLNGGLALYERGKYKMAIEKFEKSLSPRNPFLEETYRYLLSCYLHLRNYKRAKECMDYADKVAQEKIRQLMKAPIFFR